MCLFAAACDVTVARGLSAEQARTLGQRLNRDGIAVSTAPDPGQQERFQIEVAESAVAAAVQSLNEDHPRAAEPSQAAPVIPTRVAELRAREDALRSQLTAAIEHLPGVHAASVHVTLPAPSSTLDRLGHTADAPHATAGAVVLRDPGSNSVAERARSVIAAAVPGVDARAITIVESERAGSQRECAPLAHLGPVTLTTTSLDTLRTWLVASALINMLCAVALLVMLRRARRARAGK